MTTFLDRIVDGVVRDVLNHHPDYVTAKGERRLAKSLAKRLAGQLESALADRRESGGEGEGGDVRRSPPQVGALARASLGGADTLSGAPAPQRPDTCESCAFLDAVPDMGNMPARVDPLGYCKFPRPATKVRKVVTAGTSCVDWKEKVPG